MPRPSLTQFCTHGHDILITGRRKNGQCTACVRERDRQRNKTPKRKVDHAERQWAYQGMKKADGSLFLIVDYDRLYQIQGGRCALSTCRKHQSEIRNKLSVDHDHKTGIVRGLLCDSCNKNVGIIENTEVVSAVNAYLNRGII